ncbi:hypothetical protein OW763_02625 [Clostridium aestuarii]|uniref:Uncharacterized protein n=1 Tax=Clostridium aestuarii TaxID=338193 RepID=A0ABT4CW87_9CLOT|nr:hypothetical protein [Clostridium aestuarii]MCY6483249.1 hypothetical protein [Clostridium aestuarii]
MLKKETKIKITESFKNEDIDKRKETLEELLLKIIGQLETIGNR